MIDENSKLHIFRRFADLESHRAERESVWDDIIYYSHPDSGYVQTQDTRGSIRTEQIYDNSANTYLHNLAATINSMLTSQFSNWFDLKTSDDDFNDDRAGKEWLDATTEVLRNVFGMSNFYVEVFKFYYDLCSIGTAIMYVEEDDRADKAVRFSTRHIREIYFAENKYGDIDTVYRKVKMSVRKVVQRWGLEKVCEVTAKDYKEQPDKEIEILHCVYPRKDYDVENKKNTEMPFASYWFEYGEKHMLAEGGYTELPYIIARWFVESAEVYGRSPMYIALPDIITLNRMMELTLLTTELSIKPPLKATPDIMEYQEVVRIEPGSVTITDENGGLDPIWDASRGVPLTFELIQAYRDQIASTFFANQLQVIDKTQMTAEEVRARTAENAKAIGPTFGRLQAEFLEKLINRVYNLVVEQVDLNGQTKIESPPIDAEDAELEISFVSPLAKQQRVAEVNGIYSTIEFATQMAEIVPDILDNINFDEAVRIIGDVNDAPLAVLNDMEKIEEIRELRQQQKQQMEQQQMQQEQAQQQALTRKDNAAANKQQAEADRTQQGG